MVHYPKFDQEFVEDAERSGRIVENPETLFVGSQIIEPPRAAPLISSQFVQTNIAPPPVAARTHLVSSGVGVLPPTTSQFVSGGVGVLPPRTQLFSSGVGVNAPLINTSGLVNPQLSVNRGISGSQIFRSGVPPPVNFQRTLPNNNLGISGSWQANRFVGAGGFQQRNLAFSSGLGSGFLGTGNLGSGGIRLSKKNPDDKFEKL